MPFPLPPRAPALAIDERIGARLRAAEHALARLDLAGGMVPSLDWFIYAFVRKEAVISSQIEGTRATLVDLLTFEAEHGKAPDADVEEVRNYLEALSYARAEPARADGLPLSIRLLNEAHRRLMRGARGVYQRPGEVRRSRNWIGGSRPGNAVYARPPAHVLPDLLGDFEGYLHAEDGLPPLVRVGLAHVQFETIHPDLDGNGRIGRLLIARLLEHWGLLRAPLLYLSLFLKHHREEYYRRLNAVRTEGDWEGWTDFFLDGVATIAGEAVASARDLFTVVTADRARVLAQDTTSVSAARLFERLPKHPIVTVAGAMKLLNTSKPTATRAIETLVPPASWSRRRARSAIAALPVRPTSIGYGSGRSWSEGESDVRRSALAQQPQESRREAARRRIESLVVTDGRAFRNPGAASIHDPRRERGAELLRREGKRRVIADPIGEAELRLDVIGATIPLGPLYECTTL